MVQQEVKKKMRIYGASAFLLAIVLVSLIYVLGSTPGFAPDLPTTNPPASSEVSNMKTFTSYEELKNYLNTNSKGTTVFGGGPLDQKFLSGESRATLERRPHQQPLQ